MIGEWTRPWFGNIRDVLQEKKGSFKSFQSVLMGQIKTLLWFPVPGKTLSGLELGTLCDRKIKRQP